MKNFNIINKNGITLKTANTYVNDDINIRLPEEDDAKLIPENIRQGINILGITGTYVGSIPEGYIVPEGQLDITENGVHDVTSFATVNVNVAGSGGKDYLAQMINNTLTEYKTTEITSIPNNCFVNNPELHKFDAPLNTLNYSSADNSSFYGTGLDTLILRGDAVVDLPHIDVLNKTHISKYSWCDGFIVVKDELVNSYKSATNWSTFADKIYPLSDYDADKLPLPTYEWISGTKLKWDPSYGRMFIPTSSIKYGIVKIHFHITEGGYNTVKIGTWVANGGRLLLSNLDTTLASDNTIDSTNVYANLKDTDIGNITTYSNIPAGDHFIYVKYIYGSSFDYSNFNLRF